MKAFLFLSTLMLIYVESRQLSQAEIRASLITKDNFYQRNQKAIRVPKPFTVSTTLNVRDQHAGQRSSRTFFDKNEGSVVVEGVRMPDDEKDRTVWRNGRVINNVFVPNEPGVRSPKVRTLGQESRQQKSFDFDDFYRGREPLLSDNMAIESRSDQVYVQPPPEFTQARDYKYHAGATKTGRPVYYVVEEPDSLHSDRSPYEFEPADTHTSLSSQVSDYTHSGLSQASSGDFLIKEHTYTMCPGCPTFSIPVPIPKAILGLQSSEKLEYQHARNKTFLEKIGDKIVNGFTKVQNKVLEVMDPIENFLGLEDEESNGIEEKIDSIQTQSAGADRKYMPFAIASVAAMAIGGMALFATSANPGTKFISGESRSMEQNGALEQVQKAIEKYEN